MRNTLYYGDNLTILREHVTDESVDLIYLDPPFNSARDYNVLFKQAKRDENQAQITAFTDTWQWSKRRYDEFFDDPHNARLFDLMQSLYHILGASEMMAYLVMMAPRLLDLHRVLKPTGSLYLHCDPVASHYLKILLDVIFGPTHFQNEVVWKRTSAHSSAKRYGPVHDTLLFYARSSDFTWVPQFQTYGDDYVETFFDHEDADGRRWKRMDLTGAGIRHGETGKPWHGIDVTAKGRHWAYLPEELDRMDEEGRIHWPAKSDGMPRLKQYVDDMPGVSLQDVFTDIRPIHNLAQERMGYPTQKPLALLERIINASSNPGDLVLDPFCGCGTAVVAAEKLARRWIGIDITFIAIDLMVSRLAKDFGLKRRTSCSKDFNPSVRQEGINSLLQERHGDYDVIGDPKDAHSARKLFEESPKQFEVWAIGLVAGVPQPEKSGDKGVDGKVYFMDLEGNLQWAVCQVKGGHLTPSAIRDFAHVIERDKAALGFFLCLEEPTKGMYQEAEELGFFDSPSGRKIPKLQIRTIKELLDGNEFDFPKGYSLKSGGKKLQREGEQREMEL